MFYPPRISIYKKLPHLLLDSVRHLGHFKIKPRLPGETSVPVNTNCLSKRQLKGMHT